MKALEALPDIEIIAGGVMLSPDIMKSLTSIQVIQKLSMPSQCEIFFSGQNVLMPDTFELFSGTTLDVVVSNSVFPLFEGIVTAVEYKYGAEGELTTFIRGYDPLCLPGKKQRIYTYTQSSLGDIAREIVGEYGIEVVMTGDDPVWERIVQYNETDLAFLARTAQRSGYYFFYRNKVLHMLKLEAGDSENLLIRGENLLECSVEANCAGTVRSVKSSGWNPFTGELHEAGASKSNSGCDIRFKFPEKIIEMAGERKLVDIAIRNSHEAKTVSQSELDRCKGCDIIMTGVAEGVSRLFPGCTVNIQGIKSEFCGNYLLTQTTHSIDSYYGYVTRFKTTPPDFRPVDHGTNATFGIVTDINDPENMGRIKVVLDSFAETETDWMNVVLPSAGKGKGLVMLPDKNDRVLVLFMNNDPARGIVLGGVAAAPDSSHGWGLEGGKIKKYYFVSPSGHKICLDDHSKSLKIEDSSGNYLEMGPEKVKIYSKMDFEIEAKGKNVTIKGDSIDFKKG